MTNKYLEKIAEFHEDVTGNPRKKKDNTGKAALAAGTFAGAGSALEEVIHGVRTHNNYVDEINNASLSKHMSKAVGDKGGERVAAGIESHLEHQRKDVLKKLPKKTVLRGLGWGGTVGLGAYALGKAMQNDMRE